MGLQSARAEVRTELGLEPLSPTPTACRLPLPLADLSVVTSHTSCFHGPESLECSHLLSAVWGRGTGGAGGGSDYPCLLNGETEA